MAWTWHACYGHLNFDALRKLAWQEMVHGLPLVEQADQLCDACLAGKQRLSSFAQQAKYRAQDRLVLVHGDLCGPIMPATPSGKYFLLLVDDMTRFMWVVLLASKDEVAAAIKRVQAGAEFESGRKLKVPRTDRDGEFTLALSRRTTPSWATASISPRRTRRNKTVWSSGAMARWRAWPGAC